MHIIRSGCSTIPSTDILAQTLAISATIILLLCCRPQERCRSTSARTWASRGVSRRVYFLKYPKQRCSDSRPDQIWCLFLRYPTASGECFGAEAGQRCSHSRPGQPIRAGTASVLYVCTEARQRSRDSDYV